MLLDTSGILCCFDEADHRHMDAGTLFKGAQFKIVNSYVLAEFVALCHARGLNRKDALRLAADLSDNPAIEVVWVDDVLHHAALALLRARMDKSYSLCDAVSFLIMRERRISEALTTDRHFEQEGFQRLLV